MWDPRRDVKVHIEVQGAGELTFVQRAYHTERVQHIFRHNKNYGKYAVANEPETPSTKHWERPYFLNFSLPVNGSTKGIISESYLENYDNPSAGNVKYI